LTLFALCFVVASTATWYCIWKDDSQVRKRPYAAVTLNAAATAFDFQKLAIAEKR